MALGLPELVIILVVLGLLGLGIAGVVLLVSFLSGRLGAGGEEQS